MWPYGAKHTVRPVVGDAGDGDVAAVKGADEHAGERVEVGGVREVAGGQCLPESKVKYMLEESLYRELAPAKNACV